MAKSKREKWNAEKVLGEIKVLAAKQKPLNSRSIYATRRSLLTAADRYFGSWKEAIVAAGLDYNKIFFRMEWNKNAICDAIKKIHSSGGLMNSNHMQQNNKALYGAAVKYFGSWGTAVKGAGFDYDSIRICTMIVWDKKKIVGAIRSRKRRHLSLNVSIVQKEDPNLYSAARRHFGVGGWRKALKRAGINPNSLKKPNVIWTKKTVIKTLRKLHREKVPINGSFLARNGYGGLHSCGINLFGTWKKAIEAAGFDYDLVRVIKHKYWSERKILAEIRRLAKAKVRLSSKDIQKRPGYGGFFNAALKKFGSWGAAVEAAGFDYCRHCKTWSYKTWLRQVNGEQFRNINRRVKSLAKKGR